MLGRVGIVGMQLLSIATWFKLTCRMNRSASHRCLACVFTAGTAVPQNGSFRNSTRIVISALIWCAVRVRVCAAAWYIL